MSFMYYTPLDVWAYHFTNNKKDRNSEISFTVFIALCLQLVCANRFQK